VLSHWVTGIAFRSANLGPLEIMGHRQWSQRWHAYEPLVQDRSYPGDAVSGYLHGAVSLPNGLRSVPEYLRLRCNHRAHLLNSISFAVVTVLMSGINMFAFAVVFNSMLGWPFTPSVPSPPALP
jgi:solute:Na+ symporter, SSS family